MNKVYLIGNLTRDPEQTTTSNGVSVCHLSIAVPRGFTSADGERGTDFFNITAWRALADNCAKFLKKGNKLAPFRYFVVLLHSCTPRVAVYYDS